MECSIRWQKLSQMEPRKLVFLVGVVVSVILLFQSFTLVCRNVQCTVSPTVELHILKQSSFERGISGLQFVGFSKTSVGNIGNTEGEAEPLNDLNRFGGELSNFQEAEGNADYDSDVVKQEEMDNKFSGNDVELDSQESQVEIRESELKDLTSWENDSSQQVVTKMSEESMSGLVKKLDTGVALMEVNGVTDSQTTMKSERISTVSEREFLHSVVPLSGIDTDATANPRLPVTSYIPSMSSASKGTTPFLSSAQNEGVFGVTIPASNNSILFDIPKSKKKQRGSRPRKIHEMNHILRRSRSCAIKPLWPSKRDREILSARAQVENAPIMKDDTDLHAPLFRNASQFKKSYELMERILKVYVYKEGERPMFHSPLLKGLYASEGWFMKLVEENKHFLVKDPGKAHLFYLPFSARMVEFAFHKRGLNKLDMREYLTKYTDKIAAKYPFWNRTGGADHFLVACHDWAPYETRYRLASTLRALCNADLYEGFKIGKDVSLPETYIRFPQYPLKDLGGNPASKRPFLAFFAGNMHGWVRPVLLKFWQNKDPSMKIFGHMSQGVGNKMSYIQYMKSSKYCICPRGYEVNSPRVVEAIFYECVPVIISDNFVPPFFEVLDWEAFSVIIAEKDVPSLREILASITEERYLTMQTRVKKLQRHFLWHSNPVKYDIFHMTLHSIWFNRLKQARV